MRNTWSAISQFNNDNKINLVEVLREILPFLSILALISIRLLPAFSNLNSLISTIKFSQASFYNYKSIINNLKKNSQEVLDTSKESIKIDCNHPHARKALELELRIEAIESIFQERGGECIDLASHLSNGGHGMQTGQVNFGTEYYIEQPYFREDEINDSVFYKTERLHSHLDEVARN